MNNENNLERLPRSFFWITLIITILPYTLNLLGFDFSAMKFDLTHDLSGSKASDQHFFLLNGAFTHTILEWSAFMLAILTCVLAFTNYIIKRDPIAPILGVALLCAGMMDAFHTLAATRLIEAIAPNKDLIPFTWAICRLFNSAICLIGILIVIFGKKQSQKFNSLLIAVVSVIFVFIAYITIKICAQSASLPATQFPDNLITRPWDIYPLIIFFITAFAYHFYNKKHPSPFIQALLLSTIPDLATQFHMALGSSNLFDNHFVIAHFLKIVSYAVPFAGLAWTYVSTNKEKDLMNNQLKVVTDALHTNAIISETNIRGIITKANDNFVRLSKFSREELVGSDHRILCSGEHSHEFFADMWDTISSAKNWEGVIKNKAKDGTYYWVSSIIYPQLDQKQNVIGYTSIRYDITKSKEQELKINELNKHFQFALEASGQGVWDWNLDDDLVVLDKCWSLLFSENDEITMMSIGEWDKLIHEDDILKFQETIKSCTTGAMKIFKNTHRIKDINGNWIYILFQGQISEINKNNKTSHFTGTFTDVSFDIKREKELIIARDNALSAQNTKSEFLANMSHEIRTPMNGLLGMVHLLAETDLTKSQKDMLETTKHCGDSLLEILNDILDISKIDSGKFELELIDFDLFVCIEEALFMSKAKADEKNIILSFEKNEDTFQWFNGDVTRIRQIITNYLSNAIKFTENGKVIVTIETKKIDDIKSSLRISVEDTGIGIPLESQDKLFNAFTQADNSTTRKFGGTGLGLSICSKLANYMDGTTSFKSIEGKGTTFFLDLVLKNGKPNGESAFTQTPAETDKVYDSTMAELFHHRLLLVEDNNINQKLAKLMLKKFGYTCDIAANGVEALELLEQKKYSLIFMDMQMPEMDGVTATIKILEIYGKKRPKIVAMTANAFPEDRKKCSDAGMDDFIPKPIKAEELRRVLGNYGSLTKLAAQGQH